MSQVAQGWMYEGVHVEVLEGRLTGWMYEGRTR